LKGLMVDEQKNAALRRKQCVKSGPAGHCNSPSWFNCRCDISSAHHALREQGIERKSGDQPKVHEKYSDRLLPCGAGHLPERVRGYGANGREDAQHAGPQPGPASDQNQDRADKFDEDAQERHNRRRRHSGLHHFADRTRKIGDLAEPRSQEGRNQRKTRQGPSPPPFKDGSDKIWRDHTVHAVGSFFDIKCPACKTK
jgi:hypothetical protein